MSDLEESETIDRLMVDPKKMALWFKTYAPEMEEMGDDIQGLCIKELLEAFQIKEQPLRPIKDDTGH